MPVTVWALASLLFYVQLGLVPGRLNRDRREGKIMAGPKRRRVGTFTPTSKLHGDLLVHVFTQIENVFLLWPLALSTCVAAPSSSATSTASVLAW